MAGRSFGPRTVSPIFGDGLLAVPKIDADVQQFHRLPAVRPAEKLELKEGGRLLRTHVQTGFQREGNHIPPVWSQESLDLAIWQSKRLPAIRVDHPVGKVDRPIAGVVGVSARIQI